MATAVLRQGEWIDQYKIDDPGDASGFHNNLLVFSHNIPEVLRQVSSVNHRTFKANLLCWGDPDATTCPCDYTGSPPVGSPPEILQPAICFLNDIMLAGGVTVGADLSDAAEKSIYLGFWHEYRTEKQMEDMITQMGVEGLNNTQKRRGLKFAYMSQGVDITTAQSIANNRITNGVKATYDEYNLATIPIHDRRLLKIFGEVGWFE